MCASIPLRQNDIADLFCCPLVQLKYSKPLFLITLLFVTNPLATDHCFILRQTRQSPMFPRNPLHSPTSTITICVLFRPPLHIFLRSTNPFRFPTYFYHSMFRHSFPICPPHLLSRLASAFTPSPLLLQHYPRLHHTLVHLISPFSPFPFCPSSVFPFRHRSPSPSSYSPSSSHHRQVLLRRHVDKSDPFKSRAHRRCAASTHPHHHLVRSVYIVNAPSLSEYSSFPRP